MFEVISKKTTKGIVGGATDDAECLIAAVPGSATTPGALLSTTDKLARGTASAGIILDEADAGGDDASTEADETDCEEQDVFVGQEEEGAESLSQQPSMVQLGSPVVLQVGDVLPNGSDAGVQDVQVQVATMQQEAHMQSTEELVDKAELAEQAIDQGAVPVDQAPPPVCLSPAQDAVLEEYVHTLMHKEGEGAVEEQQVVVVEEQQVVVVEEQQVVVVEEQQVVVVEEQQVVVVDEQQVVVVDEQQVVVEEQVQDEETTPMEVCIPVVCGGWCHTGRAGLCAYSSISCIP